MAASSAARSMPVWPPEMIFIRVLSFQHTSESSKHDAGAGKRGYRACSGSNSRVGPCSSFTPTDDDAALRQERPRFLATVSRLGGQRQEARVMPLQVVVLMHTKPPCLCVGARMAGALSIEFLI